MFQQAIMSVFETNANLESQQKYRQYKEESNGNFRIEKYNNIGTNKLMNGLNNKMERIE